MLHDTRHNFSHRLHGLNPESYQRFQSGDYIDKTVVQRNNYKNPMIHILRTKFALQYNGLPDQDDKPLIILLRGTTLFVRVDPAKNSAFPSWNQVKRSF